MDTMLKKDHFTPVNGFHLAQKRLGGTKTNPIFNVLSIGLLRFPVEFGALIGAHLAGEY